MPAAAAVCINRNHEILMVLQGRPDEEKTWSVPSGQKEAFESYEQCCVREVWEETGYHDDPDQLIYQVEWKSIQDIRHIRLTYDEDRAFLINLLHNRRNY